MLFKRQQLLLTLVDALDSPVGHTDFQKLLFLLVQESGTEPSYGTAMGLVKMAAIE
jgi:hypothetical protein